MTFNFPFIYYYMAKMDLKIMKSWRELVYKFFSIIYVHGLLFKIRSIAILITQRRKALMLVNNYLPNSKPLPKEKDTSIRSWREAGRCWDNFGLNVISIKRIGNVQMLNIVQTKASIEILWPKDTFQILMVWIASRSLILSHWFTEF